MQALEEEAKIIRSRKIDPVTTVQDAIDALSLSLFEALRGLRDSVAPDTTSNQTIEERDGSNNDSMNVSSVQKSLIDLDWDYEDFLLGYNRDDPVALEFIKMSDNKPPKTRDEYTKLRAKFAGIRAQELMSKLAGNILSKSAEVHDLVQSLPERTKTEQMERIQQLIEENRIAEEKLNEAYKNAQVRQKKLRSVLDEVTCKSLGIAEEK